MVSSVLYKTCITILNLDLCLNLSCLYRASSYIPYFWKPTKCTNHIATKQTTKHTSYQVLNPTSFLAPRCHLQEVSLQQRFVGPTNISGTIHPHFHHRGESLKTIKFKLLIHIAATPMSHNDKPPLFLTYSRFTSWTVLTSN